MGLSIKTRAKDLWANTPLFTESMWKQHPESYGQPPYQHSSSYTSYLEQLTEEKSDFDKILEALHESERCVQNMKDLQCLKIFKTTIHTPFFKSHHNKKNLLTLKRE